MYNVTVINRKNMLIDNFLHARQQIGILNPISIMNSKNHKNFDSSNLQ